jgi:hypothetical protein
MFPFHTDVYVQGLCKAWVELSRSLRNLRTFAIVLGFTLAIVLGFTLPPRLISMMVLLSVFVALAVFRMPTLRIRFRSS